jgi:hypothetical protein
MTPDTQHLLHELVDREGIEHMVFTHVMCVVNIAASHRQAVSITEHRFDKNTTRNQKPMKQKNKFPPHPSMPHEDKKRSSKRRNEQNRQPRLIRDPPREEGRVEQPPLIL